MSERNHEVKRVQDLLNSNGYIQEEGWARKPVWKYNKSNISAGPLKIKEWDYYSVRSTSGQWSLCATIGDLGYLGLFSIAFIDYKLGKCSQISANTFLPLGKINLSAASTDDNSVNFYNKHMRLTFIKKGTNRHLMIAAPDMVLPNGQKGLDADLILKQAKSDESMNIATSWAENRKAFYLNEKVNCMPASGKIRLGEVITELEVNDAWGVLDWGRGRWTWENTWYWGSASGLVNGHRFGFNIGYGFTDRTPASENVIFYDGKVHKLNDLEFKLNPENFLEPWIIESTDKRFEMNFRPVCDRTSYTDVKLIKTNQHQVFGYFTGNAILDDGTCIFIEDFPGFAEKVLNRY